MGKALSGVVDCPSHKAMLAKLQEHDKGIPIPLMPCILDKVYDYSYEYAVVEMTYPINHDRLAGNRLRETPNLEL